MEAPRDAEVASLAQVTADVVLGSLWSSGLRLNLWQTEGSDQRVMMRNTYNYEAKEPPAKASVYAKDRRRKLRATLPGLT